MPRLKDPLENPGPGRSPGLAAALAVFAAGLVVGLGMAAGLGGQFTAGLIIVAVLGLLVSQLQRVAENTRKRVTAGEASYRAFFDHAVEGIFRTTPGGHYLAVNQALAEIYGYPTPEALVIGLTDISAQLYVDPGRRDAFRALMQAHAAYWMGWMAKGKIIVFGPVADPAGPWGLGVVRAADEAEMRAFEQNDPVILANCGFRYEVLPMLRAVVPPA